MAFNTRMDGLYWIQTSSGLEPFTPAAEMQRLNFALEAEKVASSKLRETVAEYDKAMQELSTSLVEAKRTAEDGRRVYKAELHNMQARLDDALRRENNAVVRCGIIISERGTLRGTVNALESRLAHETGARALVESNLSKECAMNDDLCEQLSYMDEELGELKSQVEALKLSNHNLRSGVSFYEGSDKLQAQLEASKVREAKLSTELEALKSITRSGSLRPSPPSNHELIAASLRNQLSAALAYSGRLEAKVSKIDSDVEALLKRLRTRETK